MLLSVAFTRKSNLLEPVIAALRARCPVFQNRVSGAARFKILPESSALAVPSAFVIPLDDAPEDPVAINSVRQIMKDSFAVIVAVSNRVDEKGQAGVLDIHAMRAEIWAALLGWSPSEDYSGVTYEGGNLLNLDRERLWYQFEFAAQLEIGPEDGWQEIELSQLPLIESFAIKLDCIDPVDQNRANPLDGRFEAVVVIPNTADPPA